MSMRMMRRRGYSYPYYYCANRRNKYVKCPDIPVIPAHLVDQFVWAQCCRLFERIEAIQATIEAELKRSLVTLLEDNQGQEQLTALKAAIDYARAERNKHAEGSYYYNLTTEDIRVKTEQLVRYEAEYASSRNLETYTTAFHNRVLGFLDFVNVMRGKYAKATFQEKRNALDVLGVMVTYTPRTVEERRRSTRLNSSHTVISY